MGAFLLAATPAGKTAYLLVDILVCIWLLGGIIICRMLLQTDFDGCSSNRSNFVGNVVVRFDKRFVWFAR